MLESDEVLWKERLAAGLPEGADRDEAVNGQVLVSEMGFLRDAGVPGIRLQELADRLDGAAKTVKAVKGALKAEADLGPRALRTIATAWLHVLNTPSDAALAKDHFTRLAKAVKLAEQMRTRSRR